MDPRIEAGAKAWDKHMGGRYAPDEVEELSEEVAVILAAADAVDPRKPRGITTVEELDALPMGAAILDPHRAVWVNDGDTVAPWASLGEGNYEGGPIWVHSVDITLPVTVLYEPAP